VAKHAKDFDIPTTTLITFFKNKDKIICHFSYQSKHENTIEEAAILIKEHF